MSTPNCVRICSTFRPRPPLERLQNDPHHLCPVVDPDAFSCVLRIRGSVRIHLAQCWPCPRTVLLDPICVNSFPLYKLLGYMMVRCSRLLGFRSASPKPLHI